jgi:hypothetical protein
MQRARKHEQQQRAEVVGLAPAEIGALDALERGPEAEHARGDGLEQHRGRQHQRADRDAAQQRPRRLRESRQSPRRPQGDRAHAVLAHREQPPPRARAPEHAERAPCHERERGLLDRVESRQIQCARARTHATSRVPHTATSPTSYANTLRNSGGLMIAGTSAAAAIGWCHTSHDASAAPASASASTAHGVGASTHAVVTSTAPTTTAAQPQQGGARGWGGGGGREGARGHGREV